MKLECAPLYTFINTETKETIHLTNKRVSKDYFDKLVIDVSKTPLHIVFSKNTSCNDLLKLNSYFISEYDNSKIPDKYFNFLYKLLSYSDGNYVKYYQRHIRYFEIRTNKKYHKKCIYFKYYHKNKNAELDHKFCFKFHVNTWYLVTKQEKPPTNVPKLLSIGEAFIPDELKGKKNNWLF